MPHSDPALGSQQWSNGSGGAIYYNGGNVGIGTSSPGSTLQIEGLTIFHRDDWGNPTLILRGQKSGSPNNWGEYALMADYQGVFVTNTQTNSILLQLGAGGGTSANVLIAPSGGNVGIGTTNPQHTLHVAGVISAEEVMVTANGADYVFGADYRLRPLSEVASYIKEHHHLPEIPSATEVAKSGVSLGEMQSKLLAKIEELTLHMIEQEKENRELRERIGRLEHGAVRVNTTAAGK